MSTLSLGQALRNAIEGEKASERFYALLADSTDEQQAKAFLKEMSGQEKRHREQLEAFGRDAAEVEVPDLPDDNVELIETMPEWSDVDEIDYESALQVALEAENHAALVYDAIADALGDEAGGELFRTIARTEDQHAENLRKLMKQK